VEAPDSSTFGELLRECRLRQGWTQEKLAEQAGISPRSISDLERGAERSHYPHTIHRLAETLGLEGTELAAFESTARSRSSPLGSRSEILSKAASVLTFLIADVRGYTRFTHDFGDEAAAELAAQFAGIIREAVTERGGRLLELRGDEALVVFHSARQAVWTAVELQGRFRAHRFSDPAWSLPVGIGIDSGDAVPVEGGYRTGALNLAARLCSMAGPGEVLLSETVVSLARKIAGLDYRDRGRAQLKGYAEPVHVIQVIAETEAAANKIAAPSPSRWRLPVRRRPTTIAGTALGIVALAAIVAFVWLGTKNR
jgi:class 3 adenylate cyclase